MKKKVKVELHTHTKYSYDCNSSFQEIISRCQKKGIDVLGIADHNEIEGAYRMQKMAPFRVIIGEEIKTRDGEIIGLFIKRHIPQGMSIEDTIKEIKRQGGITYLPHPFDSTTRKTSLKSELFKSVIKDVDIVEVYNGRTVMPQDNKNAKIFAEHYKKIEGMGSDAHIVWEFGRNYVYMDQFAKPGEFLKSLSSADFKTAPVVPWVFMITKLVRYLKKNKKEKIVKSNVDCHVCGSRRVEIVYKKKGKRQDAYFITDNFYGVHPQIVKCFDCGLIFVYPLEPQKKVTKRYEEFVDLEYEKERNFRAQSQRKTLEIISKLQPKKGKLLDIGCATGILLEEASKIGWDGYGIEASVWASKIAQEKYGLNVYRGTIEDVEYKQKNFDVITCIDVIEHVNTPRQLVEKANYLLKKGGIFCVITPDISSIAPKILREKWWHIRPDHLYYFTLETLKPLLESSDFEIVYVAKPGWSFSYDYWISRFKRNSRLIYSILNIMHKVPIFNIITKNTYTFNFKDEIAIYCRKI